MILIRWFTAVSSSAPAFWSADGLKGTGAGAVAAICTQTGFRAVFPAARSPEISLLCDFLSCDPVLVLVQEFRCSPYLNLPESAPDIRPVTEGCNCVLCAREQVQAARCEQRDIARYTVSAKRARAVRVES